jgi:hypothetical protein
MVSEELVTRLSQAIAKAEGFDVPNSVPCRANNPGDLTDDGDVGCGLIHTSGPYGAAITIYPNVSAGWQALYKKVRRMLEGGSHTYPVRITLMEVGLKYAGSAQWAMNVAKQLGVDTSTTLADLAKRDWDQQVASTSSGDIHLDVT